MVCDCRALPSLQGYRQEHVRPQLQRQLGFVLQRPHPEPSLGLRSRPQLQVHIQIASYAADIYEQLFDAMHSMQQLLEVELLFRWGGESAGQEQEEKDEGCYHLILGIINQPRQHLQLNKVSSFPMGQQQSAIARQLQTSLIDCQKQPLEVPGRPLLLPPGTLPSVLGGIDGKEHPLVQCYLLDLFLGEEELVLSTKLYRQRRGGLPWHVRVLSFVLHKSPCYCSDSKLTAVIVTEHIEARLSNFRVAKGPSLAKYKQYEHYSSLTTYQGIYLLLNTLQGYNHLNEQYLIHWPTLNSIGVTAKAAVKVWICQNWAVNTERHSKLSEAAVVEEILQLVLERTQGQQLEEVVRSRGNSFQGVQEVLGQFVIEYNQGRKSLQEKIAKGSRAQLSSKEEEVRSLKVEKGQTEMRRKHSLSKVRQQEERKRIKDQIQSKIVQSKIVRVEGQRRYQSQEVPRNHSDTDHLPISLVHNPQFNPRGQLRQNRASQAITKRGGSTTNTTTYNSPIKPVRFTYLQAPGPSMPEQVRSLPIGRQTKLSEELQFPFNLQLEPNQKYYPLLAIASRTESSSRPSQARELKAIDLLRTQSLLQRKMQMPSPAVFWSKPKQQRIVPLAIVPAGQLNSLGDLQQVESKKTIKKEEHNKNAVALGQNKTSSRSVRFKDEREEYGDSITKNEQICVLTPLSKQVQAGISQSPDHRTPSQPKESLSDITSEFRLLLQSDKKIENSLSDLSLSDYSDMEAQSQSYLTQSEVPLPGGQIYEIKEVDEEVSYSVDQNK